MMKHLLISAFIFLFCAFTALAQTPPTNTVPAALSGGINLPFKITEGISVSEVNGNTITANLDIGGSVSVSIVDPPGGLTFNDSDGSDGEIEFVGNLADINTALGNILISATTSGSKFFEITSTDLDGSDVDNFFIEVTSQDNAVDFDGIDDRITVSSGESAILATSFTFEAWVLIDDDGSPFWNLLEMPTPTDNFIYISEDGELVASMSAGQIVSNTNTFPIDGNWHHVAFVDDGTNPEVFYVDGAAVGIASDAFTNFNTSGSSTLVIGSGTANEGISGKIDEFRLWSVGRSAAEIAELYDKGLVGNETGLQIYYRFDENSGTSVPDASTATGYPGVLVNGPAWENGRNYYPAVNTVSASSITSSTANLGGNVTSAGGGSIVERGVVYSLTGTNDSPFIGGTGVTQEAEGGTTTGAFSETISGLTVNSGYSFRAYVTNDGGTAYGALQTFATLNQTPPTVTTTAASNLTSTSAIVGGNVSSNGGVTLTERGVVYALTSDDADPEIDDPMVIKAAEGGTNTGTFIQTLSSLTPGEQYSFKSYATNVEGTSYGSVQTFTLAPDPTLLTGQIAFTMYNSDVDGTGDQLFSFVVLDEIPMGTEIHFTDNSWDEDVQDFIGTTEGFLTYTTGTILDIGDQVIINAGPVSALSATIFGGAADGSVTETGSFSLSTNGDNLFAFDGRVDGASDYAISRFLTGILMDLSSSNMNTGGDEWTTIATTVNESELPSGLTNATNAVSLFPSSGETDNAIYNFSNITGEPSQIRVAIADRTNWSADDATPYGSGNLTAITPALPPQISEVVWLDSDSNGDIDQVRLVFDLAVNFIDIDGAGGTGLDVFSGITFSTVPDYGTLTGLTNTTLDLATPISGTALPPNTLTYSRTAGVNSDIVSNGASVEMEDGEVAANYGGTYTDGAPPVVIGAITLDDGDGVIDQLELQFSESITDADVTASDFTLNTGGGDDTFDTYVSTTIELSGGTDADVDDEFITLVLNTPTNVSGTGAAQYGYTGTAVEDAAMNALATFSGVSATDGADPVLLSSNPADEAMSVAIDGNIVLNFSETVQAGTGNVQISGTGGATYNVASAPELTFGTSLTIDPASDLNFFTSYDVLVDASAIIDGNTNTYAGLTAGELNFQTSAAAPTITSATWLDANPTDGTIDQLRLDFSENVDIDDQDGSGFDAITISGGAISITGGVGNYDATNVGFAIFDVTGATGTAVPLETISYDATNASGSSIISNSASVEILDGYNPDDVVDGALPYLMGAEATANSTIQLQYSETVTAAFSDPNDWAATGITSSAAAQNGSDNTIVDLTVNALNNTAFTANDFALTINDDASDYIRDVAGNTATNVTGEDITDGQSPTVVSVTTDDNDENGQIDRLIVLFSEGIVSASIDVVGSTSADFVDFDDDASYDITGVAEVASNSNTIILTISESGGADTDATPDLSILGSELEDVDGNTVATVTPTSVDGAAPAIISSSLNAGNAFIDVTFSEGIYASDASSVVTDTDFDVTFSDGGDGSITDVQITGITDLSDNTLAAGATQVRFSLSITGTAESADDTIEIGPATASSVKDAQNNATSVTATTGSVALNDDASGPEFLSATTNSGNTQVTIEFSENVAQGNGSDLRLRNDRELWFTFNANGSGVTLGGSPTLSKVDGDTYTFNFTVASGTPDGGETLTFFPTDGNEIFSDPADIPMDASETVVANLTDKLAPTFTSATFYDLDENGSIDEVVYTMSEAMTDTSIDPGDFTIDNGSGPVAAIGIETGGSIDNGLDPGTANDNIFTLLFNVEGTGGLTLAFADDGNAPLLADLAGNTTADDPGITSTDEAAPVILSATTDDTEPNGQIDLIAVVFSEDINGTTLDLGGADFNVAGYAIGSVAANGVNAADITLTPSGSSDLGATPNVTLLAGAIEDGVANAVASNFIITSVDGADPYFASVDFTGDEFFKNGDVLTIDLDMGETGLNVTVDLSSLSGALPTAAGMTSDGDGTYTYTVFVSNAMNEGDQTLAITATDGAGNTATDNSLVATLDFTAPTVSITATFTGDLSPTLAGTVDDINAILSLDIDGSNYVPNNNMDGTWTLPDNTISPDLASDAVYSVVLTGTDEAGNVGTENTNGEVKTDGTAPVISSIARFNPSAAITNSNSVVFRVTFSEGVVGVDAGDFITDFPSGTADNPVVTHVSDGSVYDLTVNNISGSGTPGTLDVNLSGGFAIEDSVSNPGPNAFAGTINSEQTYEIDQTAPRILTITRKNSSPTSAGTVGFRVTFSEPVLNVNVTDFVVSGAASGTANTVTTVSSNTIFDVEVNAISGSGSLALVGAGGQNITDSYGNAWDGTTIDSSEAYEIDGTAPSANSSSVAVIGQAATLTVDMTEAGTVYWALYTDGTASPPADGTAVKNGTGALMSGSFAVSSGGMDVSGNFTLPAIATDYDLYFAMEDATTPTANISGQQLINVRSGGVTITPATVNDANVDLCLEGPSKSLTDIIIAEGTVNDFRTGMDIRLRFNLPAGFEYDQTASLATTGSTLTDIANVSFDYPASNVLRVEYDVTGYTATDELRVVGIEVQAIGSTAYGMSQTIERGGGTAVIFGAEGTDDPDFGYVTSTARPATPSAILSGSGSVTSFRIPSVAPGNSFTLTGSGGATSYTWTDDLGNSVTQASVTHTDLNTLAGFDNSVEDVYSIFLTTTDGAGCESDPLEILIGVIDITNSEGVTNFSEDSDPTTLTATVPTGWTGSFSGPGLGSTTTGSGFVQVTFNPSTAGSAGSPHTITFTLTDGDTEFTVEQVFTVSSSTGSFLVDAGTTDAATLNYCENGSLLSFDISSSALSDVLSAGFRFTRLVGSGITTPVGYQGTEGTPIDGDADAHATSTNWQFDPTVVGSISSETTIVIRMLGIPDGGLTTASESVLGGVEFTIYPEPSATLTNISTFYCEDDESFTLQGTTNDVINGTQSGDITTGYVLYKNTGTFTVYRDFTGVSNDFNPNDPNQNGNTAEDETGTYRIEWTTEELTDGACTTTINSSSFEIRTKETAPQLDLTAGLSDYGGYNGSQYVFEFCSGTEVPDFLINTAATGSDVRFLTANNAYNWYQDGTGIADGNKEFATFDAKELFGGTNMPTGNIEFDFYVTREVNSCESDSVLITVRVFEEPDTPEISDTDVSIYRDGDDYIFEYCALPSATITYAALSLTTDLEDPDDRAFVESRSYFRVYDSDAMTTLYDINHGGSYTIDLNTDTDINASTTASASASGLVSKVFYISKVVADSIITTAGVVHNGCEGPLTKITANIHTYPDQLDVFDIQNAFDDSGASTYYMCSGDELSNIQTPGAANTIYTWYEDDGSGTAPNTTEITVDGNNGRLATQANLETAYGGVDFDVQGTYTFWVTQTTGYDLGTTFSGCESDPQKIVVQSYNDPAVVTFDDGVVQDYVVSYCEGDLTGVNFPITGSANAQFKYYISNPSQTKASAATTLFGGDVDGDGSVSVSTADLLLQNATQAGGFSDGDPTSGKYYYLISQVNNIGSETILDDDGDTFEGCESEVADMAYLTVNVYNVPAAPTTSDETLFYCDEDVVSSVSVTGESGVDIEYNWYESDGSGNPVGMPIFTETTSTGSSTITNADLGLYAAVLTPGEYNFVVNQTADIGEGIASFTGCPSEYRKITITIYEIPEAPTATDPLPQCELDVNSNSTVIGYSGVANSAGKTQFNWFDGNMDPLPVSPVETTAPTNSLSITPPNIQNFEATETDTLLTYYVSQTTNIISGQFDGCESALTEVRVVIHPEPAVPSTAEYDGSTNVYDFCEGDDLTDVYISIDADSLAANPDAEYVWYSNFTGTIINFGRADSISLSDKVLDQPVAGGTFSTSLTSANTKDYTVYVARLNKRQPSLGFEGCESDLTPVTLRVHPKASGMIFTGLQTSYCFDDEEVQFGADITLNATTESVSAGTLGSGTYTITSGATSVTIDDGDGTASFSPADLAMAVGENREGNSSSHTITLEYESNEGCIETKSTTITIKPQPELSIQYGADAGDNLSGDLFDGSVLCYQNNLQNFTVSIQGIQEGGFASKGTFALYDDDFNPITDGFNGTANNGKATIRPHEAVLEAGGSKEGLPVDFYLIFNFSTEATVSTVSCQNYDTARFTINPLPTLEIDLQREVCYSGGVVSISATHISGASVTSQLATTGYYDISDKTSFTNTTLDGFLTGTDGTATLDPSKLLADATGKPKDYFIRFNYTDDKDQTGASCFNQVVDTITINPLPRLDIQMDNEVCYDDGPFTTFQGLQETGEDEGFSAATSGTFELFTNASATMAANNTSGGFDGNKNDGTFDFNPALIASDNGEDRTDNDITFYVKFTYTDNQSTTCENSYIEAITVQAQPELNMIYSQDAGDLSAGDNVGNTTICYDQGLVRIQGRQNDANASSGTFQLFVSDFSEEINAGFNGAANNGTASFTPSVVAAEAGGTREGTPLDMNVVFTYTDSRGCQNLDTAVITINPQPTLDIVMPAEICYDAGTVQIQGTHISGFDATASNASYGTFTIGRQVSGVGSNATISQELSGGFSDNENGTATINPRDIPELTDSTGVPVTYYIRFAYSDSVSADGATCGNSIVKPIVINPLPTLRFVNSGQVIDEVCFDDDLVTFQGQENSGNDPNGVFTNATSGSFSIFRADGTTPATNTNNGFVDLGNGSFTLDPSIIATDNNETRTGDDITFQVQFSYTDDQSVACENFVVQPITIVAQPDISFKMETRTGSEVLLGETLAENLYYMPVLDSAGSSNVIRMQGWSLDNGDVEGRGDFALNGVGGIVDAVGTTNSQGQANFTATTAKPDQYSTAETFEIVYSTLDEFSGDYRGDLGNCTNEVSKNITVLPLPEFNDFDNDPNNASETYIDNIQACATQEIVLAVQINNLSALGVGLNDITFNWKAIREEGGEINLTGTSKYSNPDKANVTLMNTGDTHQISFQNGVPGIDDDDYPQLAGDATFIVTATYQFDTELAQGVITVSRSTEGQNINIGETPFPRFRWEGNTSGSDIDFILSDLIPSSVDINDISFAIRSEGVLVDSIGREFGVNGVNYDNIKDTISFEDLNISSLDPGEYEVSLIYNSESSCNQSEVRTLIINEVVGVSDASPIEHDFEGDAFGWYVGNVDFRGSTSEVTRKPGFEPLDVENDQSWEIGNTFDSNIDDQNPTNFWVTNADGSYLPEEKSWVFSPTFDISGLTLPTVSFYYACDLDTRDGVIFQYSIDDGVTWVALGDFTVTDGTTGKNWVNDAGINGNPGNTDDLFSGGNGLSFNPDSYGWSLQGGGLEEPDEDEVKWRQAAHKLDAIDGDQVRFRFALGAVTASSKDGSGFAFDNFKIYNREKVIAVEQFASLENGTSNEVATEINSMVRTDLRKDAVLINYYTALVDSPDPLNQRNTKDPGARTLYYGVSQVPKTVLSGIVQTGNLSASDVNDKMGWNLNKFNQIALDEAAFGIGEIVIGGSEQEVEITTNFTSMIDLPDSTELSFRFAIIEDEIVGQDVNALYEQDTIFSALRKMLPSAGGFTYVGAVTDGQTDFGINFTSKWSIKKIYDASKLSVAAFVQLDTDIPELGLTKGLILQSARVEVPTGKIIPDASNITANEELGDDDISIYPNPSDELFEIELMREVTEDMNWVLFDQSGREVSSGMIRRGTQRSYVKTTDLAGGLYMLHLFNEERKWKPKRVMVLHN